MRSIVVVFCLAIISSISVGSSISEIYAPVPYSGSDFGWSSATDGQILVVGAKSENSDAGAVYVYERNGLNWDYVIRLEPDSVDPTDEDFGYSVCVDGDIIVVGARGYNNNQGAIYIFEKDSSNGWAVDPVRIVASDGQADDRFGFSVAIDNDTIATGAYGHNDEKGAVYVYEKSGDTWDLDTKLYDPDAKGKVEKDAVSGSWFGYSVDIDADVIVIGAKYDYDDYTTQWRRGAACIFRRNSSNWEQAGIIKLVASQWQRLGCFGQTVAVSGDLIAVGSPNTTNGSGLGYGAVYLYRWNDTQWVEEDTLYSPDGDDSYYFGESLSLDGNRLIIGDYHAVTGSSGNAFLFEWDGSSWSYGTELVHGGGAEGDRLGCSVAVSGDVAFVGAYKVDGDIADVGVVYCADLKERIFNEFRVNTYTESNQQDSAAACNGDGEYVVVWSSYGQDSDKQGVYGQKYNRYGMRIGDEFRVNQAVARSQAEPEVAFCDDGSFVVVWAGQDASYDRQIYIRKFDAGCNPLTDDIMVNEYDVMGTQRTPAVACSGGNIMVGWLSWIAVDYYNGDYFTKVKTLDSSLNDVTDEMIVSLEGAYYPQIKADSVGGFYVLWEESADGISFDAYMQKFTSLGSESGSEKYLGTAGETCFDVVPGGGFVIVLDDESSADTYASVIRAQSYSADGSKAGSEIAVFDSYMDKLAIGCSVLGDGSLAVSWSGIVDGGDCDVHLKIIDLNGVTVEPATCVNTYTAESQSGASITAGADDKFLITWSSFDGQDGSGYGVYAAVGPAACMGDFDFNGQVDVADMRMISQRWLCDEPVFDVAPDGGDGVVNFLDYSRMFE